MLPADSVQAEQRDPAGSVQAAGQGQEVVQGVTEHRAGLRPAGRQRLHDQYPGRLTEERRGPEDGAGRVGGAGRPPPVVHRHLEAQQ